MIKRRLGSTPAQRGSLNNGGCPDVFELDSGDFLVIGTLANTEDLVDLPSNASVSPGEGAVIVPRALLMDARKDIPDA